MNIDVAASRIVAKDYICSSNLQSGDLFFYILRSEIDEIFFQYEM